MEESVKYLIHKSDARQIIKYCCCLLEGAGRRGREEEEKKINDKE
jgi:hypothetical protein